MDDKAQRHFKKADPILFKVLDKVIKLDGKIENPIRHPSDYFEDLCREIVNQQLSSKAGDTIFNRFKKLLHGKITPLEVVKIKGEKIRACGLSNSKVKYIKDLAQKIVDGEVDLAKLNKLSDEDVITELIKVKGIGKWTAEMFLMFSLGREDIFSHGDLGLKNAIKKLYSIENPTLEQVELITVKWSPYRTYASRILWRSLDNK